MMRVFFSLLAREILHGGTTEKAEERAMTSGKDGRGLTPKSLCGPFLTYMER